MAPILLFAIGDSGFAPHFANKSFFRFNRIQLTHVLTQVKALSFHNFPTCPHVTTAYKLQPAHHLNWSHNLLECNEPEHVAAPHSCDNQNRVNYLVVTAETASSDAGMVGWMDVNQRAKTRRNQRKMLRSSCNDSHSASRFVADKDIKRWKT